VAILHGRIRIEKAVNTTVISLHQAPQGYADFDKRAARKFVVIPMAACGGPHDTQGNAVNEVSPS
jgi:glutathione-independent formaldehyde dehydrogenase